MPTISLQGLANFMTASPSGQRKIVRDFKYPDPEGLAQAGYYRDARRDTRAYHRRGNPLGWLSRRADLLDEQAAGARKKGVQLRLRNNARVLRDYEQHFGHKRYEVMPLVPLALQFGDIRITATPDLYVRERRGEGVIKLEFGSPRVRVGVPRIMTQGLFEAALLSGLRLEGSAALFVDVRRGATHRGARMGGRMRGEMEAACATIADIWVTIGPRGTE